MRNERIFVWSALFSLTLAALGIGSAMLEGMRARRRREGPPLQFFSPRRTIRRLFTSAVLVALGVMIFLGLHFLDLSPSGTRFLTYRGIIFLLAAWLFLCPIFEISETRRVYRSRMKYLRDQTIEELPKESAFSPPRPDSRARSRQ